MASNPGLGRILFCDINTLSAATPENPIALGFRGEAKLDVTPFKTVKEQGGGELPNMRNFKFEAESYQPTMKMLSSMIGWLNLNCDTEVCTSKQPGAAPKADVYKFMGDNRLGLGFEYTISGDKRSLKVMCEGALEEDKAKTFIDSADSVTPATVTLTNAEGNDFALYRAPYFLMLEYDALQQGETDPNDKKIVIDSRDIISRAFTIKTISTKDIYNSDIVNKLEFNLEIVARSASVGTILKNLGKNRAAALTMKEKNKDNFYDAFQFADGVLIRADEYTVGDKERQAKISFKREVSVYDVTFQFGAEKGGRRG
ncbi:MAG TPA: hypothetical protein VHP30_16155 [Ignavibacteriales bacterium]|nr:hypothetical protein [Ignavibacteriales bacterium]